MSLPMSIMSKYRLVPEWFPQEGILMSLPHEGTDWSYMLSPVHSCYIDILQAIVRQHSHPILLTPSIGYAKKILPYDLFAAITCVEAEYNDTWIRDYGPLTIKNNDNQRKFADFGFNGWGLKFAADKDNLVINRLFHTNTSTFNIDEYYNCLKYVLEGGSIEVNEHGTALVTTSCLCSLNRNGGLSKQKVEVILQDYLGISHVLWLDYGYLEGDDTDGHIDTLARLCPDDTIVFVGCTDVHDVHYDILRKMKEQLQEMRTPQGGNYRLLELPLPHPVYDEDDGHRLPATYANYLVLDRAVLVPTYGQPEVDKSACDIIKTAYPSRVIEPVDCRALIRQHGSLHCATMQLNS